MAKGGRKYRLPLYRHILDRWWPSMLLLAISIYLCVGLLWGVQYFVDPAENPLPILLDSDGYTLIGVGSLVLLFTFFLLLVRNGAYVRLFDRYMLLVTPFFRVNISYKRIYRTTTAQVSSLFPLKKYRGKKRDIIEPFAGETANIVHLASYPLSRAALNLFLSPFFFYDKTPHFVLILDDWMSFSIEIDSRRSGGGQEAPRRPIKRKKRAGLLDDLTR